MRNVPFMMTAQDLGQAITSALGDIATTQVVDRGQLSVTVAAADWPRAALILRDHPQLAMTTLIDVIGMDYSTYGDGGWSGLRYAAIYNLLSIVHNARVRVKVFCQDDDLPVLHSVMDIWPAANWFEREAFDLFGILFTGHNDLRRILTDYGFVGHPFRKDFPVSGHVEMRYDPEQKRVVYQPVSIEPREIVPRVIREENYGVAGPR
jgi:NADH-quinone oxidoreductase subunit C